jgi:prepilin-type N-terminal cleavage/methylation domain-containing protein
MPTVPIAQRRPIGRPRPRRAIGAFTCCPSARAGVEATASRKRVAGFTFIEVVIATVILAVAALVAFPTMLSFFELSDSAHEENVATHDLMAAVEDIHCTPFATITTAYPDGQLIPKYTRLHLRDEQISVQYENPAADPLIVAVTATWSDSKGRPRQETYRCVRTR